VLFDALGDIGVEMAAITLADRALLANLQHAVSGVAGMTRYVIEGLAPDGTPGADTRIRVTEQTGTAAAIPSRAERGAPLIGTKRTVVYDRRAFVGVGGRDARPIAIIPLVDHRFKVNAVALLHLEFREEMSREEKLKALGDRYNDVVNGVTEADVDWTDERLDRLAPTEIVLLTPGELASRIIRRVSDQPDV
jgi:hypothetical protein